MQTSLVLMIFLRLVEDVLVLQTVPPQRRRDIVATLTTLMPDLFPCFVRTLRTYLAQYHAKVSTFALLICCNCGLCVLSICCCCFLLWTWTNCDDRVFSAAGLRVWNYLPNEPHTTGLVIQPFQTVAEDIFISSEGRKCSVNLPLKCALKILLLTYLLTYILYDVIQLTAALLAVCRCCRPL